jgi:hypothetical protein
MNDLLVIGVGGQRQNGKDTLADYLASRLKWTESHWAVGMPEVRYTKNQWGRSSFARAVKRIFCDTFNFRPEDIDKWKVLPDLPPGFHRPVREALTFIGDGFRSVYPNVWIERAFKDVWDWHHTVFSDVRYINEARKFKSVDGVTILIYRPDRLNFDVCRSEAELRPYIHWCSDTWKEGFISEWPEYQELVSKLESQDSTVGDLMAPIQYYSDEEKAKNQVPTLKTFVEDLSQFDVFIRNEGTMEDLYRKVDEDLIPSLKNKYKLED